MLLLFNDISHWLGANQPCLWLLSCWISNNPLSTACTERSQKCSSATPKTVFDPQKIFTIISSQNSIEENMPIYFLFKPVPAYDLTLLGTRASAGTMIIKSRSPKPTRLTLEVLTTRDHSSSTHWGRDQIDATSQTIFSDAFSWMKSFVLW